MDTLVKISKLFLVLALLPASASALTITISALNDEATTLDVTMTGSLTLTSSVNSIEFYDIGNYVTGNGPDNKYFALTSGITANSTAVEQIYLDDDPGGGGNSDDLLVLGSFSAITYTFSGNATINLQDHGSSNFGDFFIGTYDLGDAPSVSDTDHSLVIQYSSVPDTGSTAALLGVGVAALAFARRRLG